MLYTSIKYNIIITIAKFVSVLSSFFWLYIVAVWISILSHFTSCLLLLFAGPILSHCLTSYCHSLLASYYFFLAPYYYICWLRIVAFSDSVLLHFLAPYYHFPGYVLLLFALFASFILLHLLALYCRFLLALYCRFYQASYCFFLALYCCICWHHIVVFPSSVSSFFWLYIIAFWFFSWLRIVVFC